MRSLNTNAYAQTAHYLVPQYTYSFCRGLHLLLFFFYLFGILDLESGTKTEVRNNLSVFKF